MFALETTTITRTIATFRALRDFDPVSRQIEGNARFVYQFLFTYFLRHQSSTNEYHLRFLSRIGSITLAIKLFS